MAEQPYPQNLPYIHSNSTARLSRTGDSDTNLKMQSESASSEALMQRIQDLEKELGSLTTLLMEDGGFQQAYAQLQEENEELKAMLKDQAVNVQLVNQLEASNQLLKENLLKQNEQMEDLYRDLQEAKNSNSRVQERGHSQLLQSKVQGLDEEISSLLAKIHALMEQNNELITNEQEMGKHIDYLQKNAEQAEKKIKQLQMENQILKQEIHNVEELSITQQRSVQDTYMNQLEEANQQIDELKGTIQKMQAQARPGQISRNTTERVNEDRTSTDQQIVSLRNQLASKNEQLLWQRQNEANLRRKYEQRMSVDESDMMAMNEELSKLRYRLRQQQSKCAQYEFVLEQQQKDKERLTFYKNSFLDSEQLRSAIARLQAEKEELTLRTERLKAELSQRKFQQAQTVQVQRKEAFNFMQEQSDDQLQRSKQLNKKLKQAIGKYQQDYKQLREDYEILLAEKIEAQRMITTNQMELQRHKAIYQQLVGRYNDTASLYKELQQKLRALEAQRNVKPPQTNYDKENVQLIKLENSTLRQEIQSLKQQLSQVPSQRPQADSHDYKKEIVQLKRREREYSQQLQLYRQKYLKQLQKSRGDKQLENRVFDLQGKLQRVNSLLNQKLKEIDYLHNRQNELMQQVDQIYEKCRIEFDNFGVRHHPEVKKLHSELLSAQRQLMQSQLTFKQQISSVEDQLRACRLQNQHHRAKIDELLQEVNLERNSLDYSKLMRSLELSELAQKELRSQLQQREHLIHDLNEQLKRNNNQNKQRPKIESSSYNSSLKQSRRSQMSRYEQLARKRQQVAEQFKYSQQFLSPPSKESSRQEKHGILHRLRENLAA